ncbi:MAG: single-stranded-DNA-specific exonuclease RecJ, partial [Candidatus Obscuribacterales bacterium]|nr:single-stranded-DNA-specific exonuclease RecJ [Candidatus Obscuribacterales bacterium]
MDSTSPVVVKKKIWKLPEEANLSAELLAAAQGSEIIARLMLRRGIDSAEKAMAFLDPANYQPSSPMTFADMPKAVARINKAISSQERVTVYGDYDVDGVTGTSVLYMTLKLLGVNVDYYIPNRASEGYGLNLKAVSILASKHRSKLIITCDCGVSNFAEINLAKSLGVETIIVDHHSMPEVLPPAVAILHPKQLADNHPLFHLPGVGVAYKLAEALLLDKNMPEEVPKLLDFVTLGMIADMVPLVQENRYLVQIGLPLLVNSPRAGIRALMDNTVKMEGTDIVGFGLAPRINAVGRLADASLAVKLMTVDDDATAQELAHQLEVENSRRQELCEQIFFEADMKAKQALASGNDRALALYSANWHHGVVGIVASRLVEKYHCPVFVGELDEVEGKIKGSARSANGVDLYQILKANEALMTKWGGHQMAAGFSAEASNADILCRSLVETCNRALLGQTLRPTLEIDLELEAEDVQLGLAKLLRKLGPFGMWNKKPVLAMHELEVLDSRPLGKEGKHHRLMLRSSCGAHQYECVYWRSAGNVPANGLKIDLAFIPEVNVFNKSERLQLVLSDWRRHGEI